MLSAVCKCELVAALFSIESFFSLILPLSVTLQSPRLEITSAFGIVDTVEAVLQERRNEAEIAFDEFFEEITAICSEIEIDVRRPRRCGPLRSRENHPTQTTEDDYRVSLYIQYLDRLIEEFGTLFADCRKEGLRIRCILSDFLI